MVGVFLKEIWPWTDVDVGIAEERKEGSAVMGKSYVISGFITASSTRSG